MDSPTERQPWERLINPGRNGARESARNYEAFRIYYMLGAERSIAKVAKQLNKRVALLERWSVNFRWRERAEAWDHYLQELYQAQFDKEFKTQEGQWIRRKQQLRHERFDSYEVTRNLALQLLKAITVAENERLDSTQPASPTLKQVRSLVSAVANLLRVGDDLAELAINGDSGIVVEEVDVWEDVPYVSSKKPEPENN